MLLPHTLSLSLSFSSPPETFTLMETWEKHHISSSHHRHPSFSSSLLDQIYRSIDNPSSPLESTRKKKHQQQQQHRKPSLHDDQKTSPIYHRRSVAADFERSRRITTTTTDYLRYSNSSSSDSSGSSESDSFYRRSKSPISQPKPIRTSTTVDHSSTVPKPKELGGFLRTKSKALKIYSDLKKVKQPISPGGRLATFLNSLFTNTAATNPKKQRQKTTTTVDETYSSTTTCSSASSFSRSCLSKTPSSSNKSKRSVRFCPVNVILDQDSSSTHMPYDYKNLVYEDKRDVMEEHRRVIEAAKDLLRTYHTKNKYDDINITNDDDDDDAVSCASSDLFELENLSAIGIERYREELPVYETTRLDNMNRAIATV